MGDPPTRFIGPANDRDAAAPLLADDPLLTRSTRINFHSTWADLNGGLSKGRWPVAPAGSRRHTSSHTSTRQLRGGYQHPVCRNSDSARLLQGRIWTGGRVYPFSS